MVVGLGSLGLLCLIWLPPALVLQLILPRRLGQAIGRRMISFGFRLYLRILSRLCACRLDLSELDRLRADGPADPGRQPPFPARRGADRFAPAQRDLRDEVQPDGQPLAGCGRAPGGLCAQQRCPAHDRAAAAKPWPKAHNW